MTEVRDLHSKLGARRNGDLILDMGDGKICRYNPTCTTTPTYVQARRSIMENIVSFRYHAESLYILEKEKHAFKLLG